MMWKAVLTLAFLAAVPAAAQDQQTLADIRQEMQVLNVEVQKLRRELSTTGGASTNITGTNILERVDLIESELSRLTDKTEELEFRINRVVTDGTNRLGDLEFRLCELEEGCDIGNLGDTPTLGGETGATAAPMPAPSPAPGSDTGGAQLAVSEQADFDRAKEDLDSGSFQSAADKFAAFTQTYTGGPLTGEAHYYRGEALSELGQTSSAARAYLESFSGSPDGTRAPDALYKLGVSLGELGQTNEACVTLGEVPSRFPASPAGSEARTAMQNLGCS